MGGALTLAAAALAPEVDAAAPFYGIPGADLADVSKIKIPIQCHFGDADDVGCHSMCVLMCCACLKCLGGNYNTDKLGDCQVRRPVMQWNPLLTPSLPCLCAHCVDWGNEMRRVKSCSFFSFFVSACGIGLVSWCFEPSQPQRVNSGLETNIRPSPTYSTQR